MKILYLVHRFCPEYFTGAERVILNLATMMQICGHRVKVFTYSFHPPSFYDRSLGSIAIKEFVHEGVPVLAFRYRNTPDDIDFGFESPALSEVAADLIRREGPDVVHAGHTMRVGELLKSAQQLGIPCVVTLNDFFMMCPKQTLVRSDGSLCGGPESGRACGEYCSELPVEAIPKRLAAARDFLTKAKTVAAPSCFLAAIHQREFGPITIKPVRNGLPLDTLECNMRRYERGDSVVFCYAGPLDSHQGVHILIEAFMSVRSASASLRIHGTKDAPESYACMLKERARPDKRIEFRGEYASLQLGRVLESVDVMVIPSLWHESHPLVLGEALASNVPVIVSDVGGMTETVEDNVNGFVFAMGDTAHLTEVLQKVVDAPEVLNPLKGNINQMVVTTVEQEAYAYERIYNQILGAR